MTNFALPAAFQRGIENLAADISRTAYQLFNSGSGKVPAYQGADPMVEGQYETVDKGKMGIREFSGNEAYNVHTGMEIWEVGRGGTVAIPSSPSAC